MCAVCHPYKISAVKLIIMVWKITLVLTLNKTTDFVTRVEGSAEFFLYEVAIVAFNDSLNHSFMPSLSNMLLWTQRQRHTLSGMLSFFIVLSVESSIK